MELLQCSMERPDSVEESQLHSMLELHRIIGFLEIRGNWWWSQLRNGTKAHPSRTAKVHSGNSSPLRAYETLSRDGLVFGIIEKWLYFEFTSFITHRHFHRSSDEFDDSMEARINLLIPWNLESSNIAHKQFPWKWSSMLYSREGVQLFRGIGLFEGFL